MGLSQNCSRTVFHWTEFPPWRGGSSPCWKQKKKYRQYAKDCVRIAASMSGKDRQTLLDIADAWEARAMEAESKRLKSDGGRDPGGPGVVPDAGS